MTKQDKNRKGQATLEELVQSGSQLILMHDDGTDQPIEEIVQDNHTNKEVHYKSWWNQFRGPWLQSEKMSEDEIRTRADDAWGCETTALFGLKNL